MDPLALFLILLKASFLSLGGQTALPLLRESLVAPGFATEQQVVEAIAISRLGTGPGGLYIVSLGYLISGWVGAAVALVSVTIPPLLILPATALLRKQLLSTWFTGLIRGLALTTSGLVGVTMLDFLFPAGVVLQWWQGALFVLGVAITIEGKRHPALVIAIGAVIGLVLAR